MRSPAQCSGALWQGERDRWREMRRRGRQTSPHIADGDARWTGEGSIAGDPTGLTAKRQDVDLLVAAGESAVTGSAQLQTFLANYPPQPIAAHSVAKATAQRAP
jgi:hypothetical protein